MESEWIIEKNSLTVEEEVQLLNNQIINYLIYKFKKSEKKKEINFGFINDVLYEEPQWMKITI